MLFGLFPWESYDSYALNSDNFKVDTVTIYKIYDRNRNLEIRKVLLTGNNLKNAEVGIITSQGYERLSNRMINSDGILQFELKEDQLGNSVMIEGITIPINEGEMPNLTGVNRMVRLNKDNLVLEGNNLKKIKDDLNIHAKYEHEGNAVAFEKSFFDNDTRVTINEPTGSPGLQNIIFEKKKEGVEPSKEFPGNPNAKIDVTVMYTYKDQFRFVEEISDIGDLKMFPNRGEPGDKVYFTAKNLDEYDVFFLKTLDGTDPYTHANKGKNRTFRSNAGEGPPENKDDVLTVEVPKIGVGEYYVVLTNVIPENKDPMKEVHKMWVVRINNSKPESNEEKFTVISGSTKPVIHAVQPNSGPDTGQKITISGQFLGTLKIPELKLYKSDAMKVKSPGEEPGPEALEITYGVLKDGFVGTYKQDIKVKSVKRTLKTIIGDKARFAEKAPQTDPREYDVKFNEDLDSIVVHTALSTDAAIDPIKDVVIEIETVLETTQGNIIIKERAELKDAYTYIPSKIVPIIEKAVPEKIHVDKNKKVSKNTLIGIYGKNFMIHKYINDKGKEVTRYPIVQLGPDIVLDKNKDNNIELKILDNDDKELDGTQGNEIGTKILVMLPQDESVNNLGKTFVRVQNPIRNSDNMGLTGEKVNGIEFVAPDTNKIPVIRDVTPNVVTIDGGEDVIIEGSNFQDGARVFIDGKEVQGIKRSQDGREIQLKSPPGREGETQLQVMNPEGGIAIFPFNYVKTYTNPKIIDFSPKQGQTGTLVVIKGDNFLKPDPTATETNMHKFIGTRVLLEGIDVNDYNLDSATKKIQFKDYIAQKGNEVIQVESNSKDDKSAKGLKLSDYYNSVILTDVKNANSHYVIDTDAKQNIYITNDVDEQYKLKLDGNSIKAEKSTGGTFDVNVTTNGITLSKNGSETKTLKMQTVFQVKNGIITGNNVKVLGKNTIYFQVPVLAAEGYYDVTVVNPDTKRDSKVDEQGFYYFTQPQSNPKIDTIEPPQGSTAGGYDILITGSDFTDDGILKTKVIINGIEVPAKDVIVGIDGKSITVKVPPYPGDLRKEHQSDRLTVPVVVVNPDGGSAQKENGFTYVIPASNPKITKIIPQKGSAAGGDIVEIIGFDFRYYEPFDDINRNQQFDPEEGETFQDINGDGKWNNEVQLGTEDDWSEPQPLDHKIYKQYYASPILPKIYFGERQAKIVEFSRGYIKVITPHSQAGTVDVYVVNNDSGVSNKLKYTYEGSNPSIKSIVPAQGKKQGRDRIEIMGQNFQQSSVQIYGRKQKDSLVLVNFGEITNKNIPREAENSGLINAGRATVNLSGNLKVEYDGNKGELHLFVEEKDKVYRLDIADYKNTDLFIPIQLLKDKDKNPYSGYELIRVYIQDRRLIVERGYAPDVEFIDPGHIIVTTPSYYTIGTVPVIITNPDSGQAEGQYEYKNPDSKPIITNITKDARNPETEKIQGKEVQLVRVSYKGGNIISVIGSDFRENAIIQIGDILKIEKNNITYQLPNKLTFEMPSVSEKYIGKLFRVVVTNEDGASTSSDEAKTPIYIQFIKDETEPVIEKIEPAVGPSKGGTVVTITGKDFREGLSIMIGDKIISKQYYTVVDYKTIKMTMPSHEPGKFPVRVENPDGALSNANVIFTYLSAPTIASVVDAADPTETSVISNIPVLGGQEVKLKGSGFIQGARVVFSPVIQPAEEGQTGGQKIYINGKPYILESGRDATEVRYIDEGTLTVKTPSGKMDEKGVMVINPDGGASEIYEGITYGLPEIPTPTGVYAELVYDRYIKVNWNPVEGAQEYEIYVVIDDHERYFVGSTELTSFVFEDLKPNRRYKFVVKAMGEFGNSKQSMESNEVKTGSEVGPPDDDGELGEYTKIERRGNAVNIIVGEQDADKELKVDLTRGELAGSKETIIRIPAVVVANTRAKNIIVTGKDFRIKLHPNAFYSSNIKDNKENKNAGVEFRIQPDSKNVLNSRQTALSPLYLLQAHVYIGQSKTPVTYIASNIQVTLDVDQTKRRMRRIQSLNLSVYDEETNEWLPVARDSINSFAVTGLTKQLGRFAIIGNRR
jgi:hypothetical protein